MYKAIVVLALMFNAGAFVFVGMKLGQGLAYLRETKTDTERILAMSLNPRTRVAQASMQSGAETEVQKLVKVGHRSAGRRVVVGGDPDSGLNQNMQRGLGHE